MENLSSTKKITFTLLLTVLFSVNMIAQQTIKASTILKDIKKGKAIVYKNATITGTLDMTFMDEKLPDLPRIKKWWNNGSNTVEETIESEISFINCVFDGEVLAYIHDEDSGYTFIANFENDIRFKNCEFKHDAMFKYSNFEYNADFSDSQYKNKSTFKYADFKKRVSFANSTFSEDAVFKYTKFRNGISFKNAHFEDNLNLKYAKIRGDFNISGMVVSNEINSKYTDINGKGFSKYLIENKH